MQNQNYNLPKQSSLIEIALKDSYGLEEVHRMYPEGSFNKLKKKIIETFGLKKNVNCIYYYENNKKGGFSGKICVKTEEDYEIMIATLNNQKIIYAFLYN